MILRLWLWYKKVFFRRIEMFRLCIKWWFWKRYLDSINIIFT